MIRTRNIFPISLALLLALFACESDPVIFEGPYHVRFTESTAFARESFSKTIDIKVHLAGPALDEDIEITYTIGGDAREGVDYVILDDRTHVVIPAGDHFGNIRIQLLNNANNILRSQRIVFTLRNVSSSSLQVGQESSALGSTFTFTIFDDCILGGDYIGKSSPFALPVDGITIASDDCEIYRLSNWDIDIFDSIFDYDLTFKDNGDNTLTIPVQESDDLSESFSTISGSGIVNPLTREITLTVKLNDYPGQPEFTFTLLPD